MAYERAVFYGLELLGHEADGFNDAKKNEDTFKKWLDKNFDDKEDAENLFWVGYAWLGRVNIAKDEPALVGDLFIGVAMLEKSVQLEPRVQPLLGHRGARRVPRAHGDERDGPIPEALRGRARQDRTARRSSSRSTTRRATPATRATRPSTRSS